MEFEIYGTIMAKYLGNAKLVHVPEGITCVDQSAFYGCQELEEIHLPQSLRRIERSAFAECPRLRKVAIQPGLDTIGDAVFEHCQSLEEIALPLSLQYIGGMAFAKCSSLAKIKIPKNVTRLQYGLFMACTNLRQVELPLYVSEISPSAFYFCKNLEEIYVPDSVSGIHPDVFYGCSGLRRGYVPKIILDYYRREEQLSFAVLYLSGMGRYTGWEKEMYESFIRQYKNEVCQRILAVKGQEALSGLLELRMLEEKEMDQWIEQARRGGEVEFTAKLLQAKASYFEEETDMWEI